MSVFEPLSKSGQSNPAYNTIVNASTKLSPMAFALEDPVSCTSDYSDTDSSIFRTSSKAGPTVAECLMEIESLCGKVLEDIKDLTDQRDSVEAARELETARKQPKYVDKFLEGNYSLTISILNLRTRYLSIKFAFLNGMADKLKLLDPLAISPPYLRIRTFHDWLKHAPIVDEIQDELLLLRTRKVRLKRKFLATTMKDQNPFYEIGNMDGSRLRHISLRLRAATNDLAFLKIDIDNIQNQLNRIIKDSSLLSSDGSDVLSSYLNDPRSFENRKINEYITECIEYVDQQGPEDEWASILVFEDSCPEPFSESVPGANPSRYQEYVKALTLYICDKLRAANIFVESASVFTSLELRILPKIYHQAMGTIRKSREDEDLYSKCKRISGFTQEQIGIPKQYCSRELLPYYSAISRFKSLVFSMTPTKIMQAISFAANDIHNRMVQVSEGNEAIGADAFLPIWVYCIIKANIPNLASIVNFLKGYLNPDLRYCEIGYYVTCLEGACVYIKELKEDVVSSNDTFIIFDREKYKILNDNERLFNYERDITLEGYKLYLHTPALTKAHRFYKCGLAETGLKSDTVIAGIVRKRADVTYAQVEFLEQLMSTAPFSLTEVKLLTEVGEEGEEQKSDEDDLYPLNSITGPRNTGRASTVLLNPADPASLLISCGDFNAISDALRLLRSLERVTVVSKGDTDMVIKRICHGEIPPTIPESILSCFAVKYGFYLKRGSDIHDFMCKVQILLQHLDFLSVYAPVDGTISELVCTAIKTFQKHQNSQGEYIEKLPETGYLTPETYNRLRDTLKDIFCNLRTLNYRITFNPLSTNNATRTHNFIKRIQADLQVRVYIPGTFTERTVDAINRALYEDQVIPWCKTYTSNESLVTSP